MRHIRSLFDISTDEILQLFSQTSQLKEIHQKGERPLTLEGRVLALVFEKPSLRTRASFQGAMAQLGGSSLYMSGTEAGMGTREPIADFAKVLSQYVDGVVLRTFGHGTLEEFAEYSSCPVINGLSDLYHPCQALSDLFTIQEAFGELQGKTLLFVGDGNNVARSLAICCAHLGVYFILACPKNFGFKEPFIEQYQRSFPDQQYTQTNNPIGVIDRADVIYTDVWTSMGQESEREDRLSAFADYQVNEQLLEHAPEHTIVMHCLPAHRGEEISAEVLDGERSVVFQQAGNRLHLQKALLQWLLQSKS